MELGGDGVGGWEGSLLEEVGWRSWTWRPFKWVVRPSPMIRWERIGWSIAPRIGWPFWRT